jgi:hypothetical protein
LCQISLAWCDFQGMNENPTLLLALRGTELTVVLDALVAFAVECEDDGDPCGCAPVADYVANRIRALDGLSSIGPELMKMHGLGRFKNRPQG